MKENGLPTNWKYEPIGKLCELINGRAFKPSEWSKEGLPIIRIQNLNDETKPFNYFNSEVAEKHMIKNGDVLLSWSGTPGTSFGCFNWQGGEAVLNQHIFKVLVDEKICDKEFFIFAVNNILDEMIAEAHGGVGLRHITKGKLENLKLAIAPLEEQKQIVGKIKECLSRVDEIKQLREESRKEAEAIFPSVLSSVFDDLNDVDFVSIDDVVLETRYGTSQKCNTQSNGISILRIPNIGIGTMNFENLKHCNTLTVNEISNLLLKNGDILVVRTNGSPNLVGRCAVFENKGEDFGYASYLIRFRVDKDKVNPKFLSFFLTSSQGRKEISKIRRSSAGQYNVNGENLKAIKFPFPDLEIQNALVEKMESQKIVCEQLLDEQIGLSQESLNLTQSILSKAFAGEL